MLTWLVIKSLGNTKMFFDAFKQLKLLSSCLKKLTGAIIVFISHEDWSLPKSKVKGSKRKQVHHGTSRRNNYCIWPGLLITFQVGDIYDVITEHHGMRVNESAKLSPSKESNLVVSNVFVFSNGCFTPVCKRWPICDEDFIQIGWSKTTDLDTLEMTSCLTPSEIRYGLQSWYVDGYLHTKWPMIRKYKKPYLKETCSLVQEV